MSLPLLPIVSDQDFTDAAVVTTQANGSHFEIQLGHLCNNRCVFCSSGQLSEMKIARAIRLDPILQAIEQGRAGGATRITFLGGEPTIHKGFLAALQHTVDLGFEEVVIFTNGVMLPVPGFIDKVIAIGQKFEWRISIQGGNEEAHVAVTKRKDSFRRIVEGLEVLKARGQDVTANLCVNEESYRSLPDYPALVSLYGIRQLHVDMIRPPSTGERSLQYLSEIMPRYSEIAPYIEQMLATFEETQPDFDVNIGNLPFCVLPQWGHRIHHGGTETITASCDASGLETPVDKYEWHGSLRRHLPSCEGCVFKPQCKGVFHEYLDIYGGDEFQAVTEKALIERDPTRRNFVLLARQSLQPLLTLAGSPTVAHTDWRGAGTSEERFARVAEARFALGERGVTCRFARPETTAEPVDASCEAWQLSVYADPLLTVAELGTLLQTIAPVVNAAATLGQSPCPLDVEAILTRHHPAHLEARSRSMLGAMLGRVRAIGRSSSWRLVHLWGDDNQPTGGFEIRDGTSGRIVFELEAALREGRPNVSVRSKTGAGTDDALARAEVARWAAVMRGAAVGK